MNIEAAVIAHLRSAGFEAYADVPTSRPSSFVTVERVGGTADAVAIERPTVAVQSWAQTRYQASELALLVDESMRALAETPEVTRVSLNSMHNHPDVSGQPRYQGVYDIVCYK